MPPARSEHRVSRLEEKHRLRLLELPVHGGGLQVGHEDAIDGDILMQKPT